eukprot:gnl/TRDRNA2_/TRDRNA2_76990_c1_seq1.p1 gnl/TRDRNA2_/TRDRNA2_76990_c1~~gnl/TRDRNA2_/TRDRNA2_76990_c1_seq1.p1  ORF type:complete len:264 (-),score=38.77 gnl/TRDRNA2_/TRDRNA2_76990_c1_seq1:415-1095(-)
MCLPDRVDELGSMATTVASSCHVDFVVAPRPFCEGKHRLCYWGVYRLTGKGGWMQGVFKKLKPSEDGSGTVKLQHYRDEIEKSATADFFAQKFNAAAKLPQTISFLVAGTLEDIDSKGTCYLVEPVLPHRAAPGASLKYNDNRGGWNAKIYNEALGAFTRWTYHFSSGRYMVVDLQGVQDGDEFVFTNPAILHEDLNRFGDKNTGPEYMEKTLNNIPRVEVRHSCL